ncbi:MAG: DUF4249 family protein [Flavipsychrobacter sp.]|nr:DUF4249 family protein [Flavipsychrobacter sp.]
MRVIKKILSGCFCALLLLVAGGCSKTLDLPAGKAERKIVLFAELVAGDSLYMRAGLSVAVTSGSDMKFTVPDGLSVVLSDGSSSKVLPGGVDSLTSSAHTYVYTDPRILAVGDSFAVSATYPGMETATATVVIPKPVSVSLVDTVTVQYNSDSTIKFRLKIDDDPSADNYYVVECLKQHMDVVHSFFYNDKWLPVSLNRALYARLKAEGPLSERMDTAYYRRYSRIQLYTNDNNTENAYDEGLTMLQDRVLLKDRLFNGSTYYTDVYVRKAPTVDSVKGVTIFYVKNVTREYFEFLKSYEQYSGSSSSFNSLDQPRNLKSNVKNGGGVVGGVSQTTFRFLMDNWSL